jgi:predicted nucleotidyltransferase
MNADAPLDAEEILRALARHSVDYVIVGGLAVQAYGHVRTTVDIDIYPRPERSNLVRLAAALQDLRAEVLNRGAEGTAIDASMLPRATLWQFSTRHGGLDVLHDAPGAPVYEQLRARSLELELGDVKVAVAGLDDLIGMKRASGRPIDLEDLAALRELG